MMNEKLGIHPSLSIHRFLFIVQHSSFIVPLTADR